jgi:ABC-2 type transport system ATP-binding protein
MIEVASFRNEVDVDSTMVPVIVFKNLTKTYGDILAVQNVNLEVFRGEIFGYLGPNGSGKTTTIRTALDFIRPSSGSAAIFGLDSREHSTEIKTRVGYLPGDLHVYEKMTGHQLLTYLFNLRGDSNWDYVHDLTERFDADLERSIGTLSRGNKQKIGLIQAFMNEPELIVMDEPTSGLDPLMQQEFYSLVEERRDRGCTVFVSSHIVPEIERLCDRVAILRQGELIALEQVSILKERAHHRITLEFGESAPIDTFLNIPGIRDVQAEGLTLRCTIVGSADALVKCAAQFEVLSIQSEDGGLEDVFLDFYQTESHNLAK